MRRAPLPSVLTDTTTIDGYKNPQWLPVRVEGERQIAVQQSLVEIEQRLVPAARNEIIALLAAQAEYYDVKQSREGLTTRLSLMADDLAGYSANHIAKALQEHRQKSNFFPKTAELRELLDARKAVATMYRHRARVALGLDELNSWERSLLEAHASRLELQAVTSATTPELEARIAALPPELGSRIRKTMDAARRLPAPKAHDEGETG